MHDPPVLLLAIGTLYSMEAKRTPLTTTDLARVGLPDAPAKPREPEIDNPVRSVEALNVDPEVLAVRARHHGHRRRRRAGQRRPHETDEAREALEAPEGAHDIGPDLVVPGLVVPGLVAPDVVATAVEPQVRAAAPVGGPEERAVARLEDGQQSGRPRGGGYTPRGPCGGACVTGSGCRSPYSVTLGEPSRNSSAGTHAGDL